MISTQDDSGTPRWAKIPTGETEYSDWQIDVRFPIKSNEACRGNGNNSTENDATSASYLVHRYRIGKKSEYFKSVFRDNDDSDDNNRFSESQERRSKIEFSANETPITITMKDFETLLDYLYLDKGEIIPLDDKNIFPMMYFADYFGIQQLREECKKFTSEKITFFASTPLLANLFVIAKLLSCNDILDSISILCIENQDQVNRFMGLWNKLDPPDVKRELLHRMCTIRKNMTPKQFKLRRRMYGASNLLSCFSENKDSFWHSIIAHAIEKNPEVVDRALFSAITEADNLGKLESFGLIAIRFLEHEHRLDLDNEEDSDGANGLTRLQEWCIDNDWKDEPDFTKADLMKRLRKLKPSIMEAVLLRMMKKVESLENDNKSLKRKRESLENDNTSLKRKREEDMRELLGNMRKLEYLEEKLKYLEQIQRRRETSRKRPSRRY